MLEEITLILKTEIQVADEKLKSNLSKEEISYFLGVKSIAIKILKFAENYTKKEEEELLEILKELPSDIGKIPAPTGLFRN